MTLPSLSLGRRRWPVEEKRRIVELTMREDASVRTIAQQFRLHESTVSAWRALYREGQMELGNNSRNEKKQIAQLLPVTVTNSFHIQPNQSSRVTMNINLVSGTSVHMEIDVLHYTDLAALITALQ